MITREKRLKPRASQGARRCAAFTLPEAMVASGLFALVVIGSVYTQMYAMRQDQWVNSKIGASEMARLSFNALANDIRSAKIWQIGNGNLTSFTGFPLGTNQCGNALKLSMTTDTNQYYLYYFDTNKLMLYRGHSGATNTTCLASHLTNTMYFQAQNYHGDNQTTLTHKGVIYVFMQFCEYQYPITKIGPGCLYDYYNMQLRLTPHTPDGP
jgi:hypothetical protein